MSASNERIPAVDRRSHSRLAELGLEYRLVDASSDADLDGFLHADARGFLDDDPTQASLAQQREHMRDRRNVGVYDPSAGAWPVATVNSWVTPLTVPGGEVDMWAISSVTVAGTHRRRGIARNLLEGELRAAADAGIAVAGLTVSEATIYGRYGFASAIPVARLTIETPQAGWAGAPVPGRLLYTDKPMLVDELDRLHDEARRLRSGQIAGWRGRWLRSAGLAEGDRSAAAVRGVRYVDAEGVVRGAMAFTLSEVSGTFRSELKIRALITTTDEALRALWQFVIQHDLVLRAHVDLRPVDDPLPWLVADQRAVKAEVHDHGWLRILDVPAALTSRTYAAPADAVIRVDDPLGLAGGSWRIAVDESGAASVERDDAAPDLELGIAELSAIYAGGVPLTRLASAGRVRGDAETVAAVSRAFLADPAPTLGIWY
ncbi:GNAT family N-acetyltransferase [Microbacterium sp. ARD32]|uniref:GNAT family N-acetyltransferase n=1 Tax=Microbacterium sp. ARD32 TaxID=2962577 RepID=UPI002882401A|nr:GNAT family N-acetyltransferase [Microbacterium sp. ARD32]MDT0156814.1 GNAT family N-acetyltransferase [Microbacterium sp. ARD32]